MAAVQNRQVGVVAALLVAAGSLAANGPAWAGAGAAHAGGVHAVSSTAGLVTVRVDPGAMTGGELRAGFIGLSFPSSELNTGRYSYTGDLPALLRNLGNGVMRFGGNSVDRSSFTGISHGAARALAALVSRTGWKVLYSVNLGTFHAAQVTADARRIAAALRGHLLAIACGNEPELFASRYRPSSYNEADYLSVDLPRCLHAVRRGAPRVRFAGPDTFQVSGGPGHWHTPWLPDYARAARAGKVPGFSLLAAHLYPETYCWGSNQGGPTALISAAVREKERGVLAAIRSAAGTARVPYLISESNSASCSGIPGVSDTYASALWAADWLMLAAERGALGVAFNGGLGPGCTAYTPLCETGNNMYSARPVYYGMLFTHMLGTGRTVAARLMISDATGAHVVAHAVRSSSGVARVMVENLGGASVRVLLKDSRVSGRADAWYLTGPSLGATSGVRIQGAMVSPNGTFLAGPPSHVTCRAGSCGLTLPAYGAVIVRLPK